MRFKKYPNEDGTWYIFSIGKFVFGLWLSYGKPIWYIPQFWFLLNRKEEQKEYREIFDIGFGWLIGAIRFIIRKY